MDKVFVCSDLDRTILPNGLQLESEAARPLLRRLAGHSDIIIAYVSGRDKALLQDAIREYDIPPPDYAVGDVGSTIYAINDGRWHVSEKWEQTISPCWKGRRHDELAAMLTDITELRMQEKQKQNTFKLSYYVDPRENIDALLAEVKKRLEGEEIDASVIWSVDETENIGLLDILPACATKLHAVRFLMELTGVDRERTVYAGDSGNDLPVLTSDLQTVLVKNATEDVRKQAVSGKKQAGHRDLLYLADGGFLGLNGNYTAGVLEGVAHFIPELEEVLRRYCQESAE